MSVAVSRLILFDCDGTLVDSVGHIHRSLAASFALMDIPEPSLEAVRLLIGLPLTEVIARLVPEAEEADVLAVAQGYRDVFRDLGGAEGVLYDGAADVLTLLGDQAGLLGVATGKGRAGLRRVLRHHGIDHHFCVLKTADDGPGKPAPDIVLDAMAETGCGEEQTYVIGDTTYDMEMAYNAGVSAIGVAWGYHDSERLKEAGAAAIAQRFDDIPTFLEAMRTSGPKWGRGTR